MKQKPSKFQYYVVKKLRNLIITWMLPSKHSSWKTSWRRLKDVFRLRLQKTSWSRRIYSPYSYVFIRRLQDVFKTSSGHLQDILLRHFQDVFKKSSRRLAKMSSRRLQGVLKTSSRHLQDVFKTYHRVNLFLLTRFQDVFETFSKCFSDVVQRWLSIERFA